MATARVRLTVRSEACPSCMDFVKLYAKLSGGKNWLLEKRCFCEYLKQTVQWPFDEEATLAAVKSFEFEEHGILLHNGRLYATLD